MSMSLLILAAGMGSRYGGLKQLESFGPSGETIIDYSLYDAARAGFDRAVFVIRRDMAEDFQRVFCIDDYGRTKYPGLKIDICFQDMDDLPGYFSRQNIIHRKKPWGTAHALWSARNAIGEPFAVMNADDFYGRDAIEKVALFLSKCTDVAERPEFCMAGYRLADTLSASGGVSRGICRFDGGKLLGITEVENIVRRGGVITSDNTDFSILDDAETVSMNLWGFTPDIFPRIDEFLKNFLISCGTTEGFEAYIPSLVNSLIERNLVSVSVLPVGSDLRSKWFGVTYAEDKALARDSISAMIKSGCYPNKLWG